MSDNAGQSPGTSGVTQEVLLSAPLAQFPGKQITVFIGNFEPGAATPYHRHPGTELLFVLEGQGVMHIDGAGSRDLQAGNAVLVNPEPGHDSFTHQAVNTDGSRPMSNLVVVIHDEGTPPALPVG